MTSTDADRVTAEECLQSERFFDALKIYNRIIGGNAADTQAWVGVGMVMVRTLQWRNAAETFRFVLQMAPGTAIAMYGLSIALFHLGDTKEACEMADVACSAAPADWRIHQWRAAAYSMAETNPERALELHRDWGRRFADPLTARARPLPKMSRQKKDPGRRLKVGYVSADLRQHAVAFFMEPVFAHHNPEVVEVFVYSSGQRDSFTKRIESHVKNWFDVFSMSDEELVALIRSHEIDILVDLSGHTVGHRLFTFARRAAPVQVTWLGYMGPLGMKAMDYRLTDGVVSPQGSERYYSEALFRLDCMGSYAPPSIAPEISSLPMLSQGHPTLISLNNSKKVTDEMLGVWANILELRQDAHLILMTQEIVQDEALAHMQPRLKKLGLPLDRVHVSRQLSLSDFMTLGGLADIALDTSPISGGTTTCHGLWMGLPIVALEGQDGTSGSSAQILRLVGCDEFVAVNKEAYKSKVLALMDSPQKLKEHRQTVRQRMLASPLMDYAVRTAEIERAYRLMWINHLVGDARYLDTGHDLQQAMKIVSP